MKINQNWIGYCTNVHAGSDLKITRENLERFAVPVKNRCVADQSMGIGLWLSDQTATDLISNDALADFGDWLQRHKLVPFTFNGFPYGNFHQEQVKKLVYLPTWVEDSRREYSERLAQIQHQLLPSGMEGSISTLPLAWHDSNIDQEMLRACASQLLRLARFLEELEQAEDRLIYFCLEPEPGCVMQTSQTCVDFFQQYLLGQSSAQDALVRRYLRVCHDICHSAVMFEDQAEFLQNITSAGIQIGKVQVSSAVHAIFEGKTEEEKRLVIEQLSQFHEPRYLHQTVLQTVGGDLLFFEDLPAALAELKDSIDEYDEARVHFHVPIHLKEFGQLKTSQTEILQCLEITQNLGHLFHYEVETYAWNVLPNQLQPPDLSLGISDEIQWLTGIDKV